MALYSCDLAAASLGWICALHKLEPRLEMLEETVEDYITSLFHQGKRVAVDHWFVWPEGRALVRAGFVELTAGQSENRFEDFGRLGALVLCAFFFFFKGRPVLSISVKTLVW